MIRIHDQATDEVIDREMTEAEFAKFETDKVAEAAKQAEAEAQATARAAILDRIGLTAEEAALLLS